MKRHHFTALALMLAALPASAEEKRATDFDKSSNSSSSSSFTDGNGNTVTTTASERDGKRETRRTVTGPGGKVLSETNGDEDAEAKPGAKPAAQSGKPGGPWLGVHTAELPPAMREQLDIPAWTGLLVEQLPPDSPAGAAGIAQHDILLTFNLTPLATPEALRAELAKCRPGEKVLIEYLHKSRREKAAVTLGKRGDPEAENAAPNAVPNAAPNGAPNAGPKAPHKNDPLAEPFARFPKLPELPGFPKGLPNTTTKSSTRTVIIGNDGKTKVFETDGLGDPFASMLRDPNVPAAMKESLRKMQEQMRDFQKRTQDTAPGNAKPGHAKPGKADSQ